MERAGCVERTADYIVLQELLKLRSATSDFWWIHADRRVWSHHNAHVRYQPFEIGAENELKPGCCIKSCFLRRKGVALPEAPTPAPVSPRELLEMQSRRAE